MMTASQASCPDTLDADVPRSYRPDVPMPPTSSGFPRDPLPIFDDPRLYSRIDPDTLFYVFYYKQGTAQQYLAAKALKDQSWRFHKQYQTWFQRHEEPKNITEEFEQGTYRFFDYESTW
jgi:CCR4-NOT transcription complex subunit 3